MPLTPQDRRFLQRIDRLKLYLILIAAAVFCYLLLIPTKEIQMATSVIGIVLCGVFWLTQRLLTFITVLDLELTRVLDVVKRTLSEEQRKQLHL